MRWRLETEDAAATEFLVAAKDISDGLGFSLVDDQLPLLHVVAERRIAAHHMPFFFEAAIDPDIFRRGLFMTYTMMSEATGGRHFALWARRRGACRVARLSPAATLLRLLSSLGSAGLVAGHCTCPADDPCV
jgi:hypothetical protein